jgi:hypothetical protein
MILMQETMTITIEMMIMMMETRMRKVSLFLILMTRTVLRIKENMIVKL